MAATFLGDLGECVTRHVLHTFVRLVHKLKVLVYDSLEELPVRLEEAGVLTDDVHDVRCHDRLVVLAPLHLTQAEQILDDGHEESLLCLLVHRS